MSLFQRLRTPFREIADEGPAPAFNRPRGIGDLLRERREELDLDLDGVGEELRIKPIYLAALEQGRTQDLPGSTYAIGFIRAYAHYLGFDAERILARYKTESAEVQARPDLALPVPLGPRSVPGGPILLVGVILALCGYGTWYYLSTGERNRPERVAEVPAALRSPLPAEAAAAPTAAADRPVNPAAGEARRFSSGLAPSPDGAHPEPDAAAASAPPSVAAAATPAPLPAPADSAAGTSPPTTVAAGDANRGGGAAAGIAIGQIDIRALADCWIQVRGADDQTVVFSRVLKAGETYHVPRSGLLLRTGNAGALAVAVDGKPAPAIGSVGTLRRNVALDPQALLAGTAVRG